MKSYKFLFPILTLGAFAVSCDTDIETVKDQGHEIVEKPVISELYYQNLRDYKQTDHEIAFGWFSGYG
ncbi:MAG: glycosyl hydrolase, partial [Muribaculum sp.]|nr:glycosyl hydrolase [Muribaculum sp.]